VVLPAYAQQYYLMIGTYTQTTPSKGIYVYTLNAETGAIDSVSCTEAVNPSFLTISPNSKYVYSCTETKMETEGNISAYQLDKKKGTLKFLNKQPSGGRNPVYVSCHRSNKWIVAANYTDPYLSLFKIKTNGKLMPYCNTTQFNGTGPDSLRQSSSHLHAAFFTPDNSTLVVTNLGSDEVMLFPFHAEKKMPLYYLHGEYHHVNPGGGPRHAVVSANGRFLYCLEELSGSLEVFDYLNGMVPLQRVLLHPEEAMGPFASSDVHISPDGKFLYAANRGSENNLAIFSIDQETGMLTWLAYQPTLGENPRNFIIDPTGNFIIVANQTTGNMVVFKRDPVSGLLTDTGIRAWVPAPSCLQLVRR
jgi:6-phosphogluconolactonase